jgi:hypothetical protein
MNTKTLDILDGAAAALCTGGFIVSLVSGGASIWVLVSLPIVALLAVGRIGKRHKKA